MGDTMAIRAMIESPGNVPFEDPPGNDKPPPTPSQDEDDDEED
jgi:hypothetical protein